MPELNQFGLHQGAPTITIRQGMWSDGFNYNTKVTVGGPHRFSFSMDRAPYEGWTSFMEGLRLYGEDYHDMRRFPLPHPDCSRSEMHG